MRYFLLIFGLAVLAVMLIAGKRGDITREPPVEVFPDMDRQPKLRPQARYAFFEDSRSSRLPVPGTIARGEPYQSSPENTGRVPGTTNFVEIIPLPLAEKLMLRGQERYQIFCTPCHGAQADGNGVTKKFGMTVIANLHDPRIVSMPDGEIFNTITYGKVLMGPYGGQIAIEDRWAIVAYVRALQRARLGTVGEVPEAERTRFGQ